MSITNDARMTEQQHREADKFAIAVNPKNDPNLMPGGAQSQGALDFYVVDVGRKWPNGSKIRVLVRNMTGDPKWSQKVIASAQTWEKYANIDLDIMDYDVIMAMSSPDKEKYTQDYINNPDIRVKIHAPTTFACNSYIGTTCRYFAQQGKDSINFNFGNYKVDDSYVPTVVIHEFGHALGFAHEHNNVTAKIEWNKEAVYAHFAKQGWTQAQVDHNVFADLSGAQYEESTGFDTKSIMSYGLPNAWIKGREQIPGYYVSTNFVLSDTDKRGALKHYPVTEGVIIYDQENLGGDFKVLRPGAYSVNDLGIGDNKVRSFQIIGNMTLTMHDNSDFSGASAGFWGENTSRSTLNDIGLKDVVSSIKVFRGLPKAIIYTEKDYRGGFAILVNDGDYNLEQLGIGNDNLSSIRVFPGSSVTLYESRDFAGAQKTLTMSSAYVGDDWNDRTSSIRVKLG